MPLDAASIQKVETLLREVELGAAAPEALESCTDEEVLLFHTLIEIKAQALKQVMEKRGLKVPETPLFKPQKPS